jgi:outer membrane lipoprotein SlyB
VRIEMKRNTLIVSALVASMTLGGCATGANLRADTYSANQVGVVQTADAINIISTSPAKVEVDNSANHEGAKKAGAVVLGIIGAVALGLVGGRDGAVAGAAIGGLAGAAVGAGAGSLVSSQNLVDGVKINFSATNGTIGTLTQVGRMCEYNPGAAILNNVDNGRMRVQPNAVCPQ